MGYREDAVTLSVTTVIERRFGQPNKHTFLIFPIKQLLSEELDDGVWFDPFAGWNSPAQFTNDGNRETLARDHEDGLSWLSRQETGSADGVLYDPPYSLYQAKTVYESHGCSSFATNMAYWSQCRDEVARIVKPGGKVISCGWTSMGMSQSRGFFVTRVLLVPHGGARNDTIVTVELKL